MSHDWMLRCVDCQADLDMRANWGCDELWSWIDSADLIATFLAHPGQEGMTEINRLGWYPEDSIQEFVVAHRHHQMVPVSEYDGPAQGPGRRLLDGHGWEVPLEHLPWPSLWMP